MGLWSLITGAGKTGDVIDLGVKAGEGILKGLDSMVYTDEEKAVAGAKEITKNMSHVVTMAKLAQNESGASAITRRIFGLIVLGNFTIFTQVGLVFVCLGKMGIVQNIIDFAKAIMIGQLAITVVVSVFGYYSLTKNRK